MPLIVPPPSLRKWRRTESARVASFRVFGVERHLLEGADGKPRGEFHTLACPDWCNVVAVTETDELVLLWQYRFGTDALSLEIAGGMVDPGEAPLEAARRELREETGYVAATLEPLCTVEANPALQGNRCHMFMARGARRVSAQDLDEHEECEVALVPVKHARALIEEGHVTHSLVVCALQAFLMTARP